MGSYKDGRSPRGGLLHASNGKMYVGSAYGDEMILNRWKSNLIIQMPIIIWAVPWSSKVNSKMPYNIF